MIKQLYLLGPNNNEMMLNNVILVTHMLHYKHMRHEQLTYVTENLFYVTIIYANLVEW